MPPAWRLASGVLSRTCEPTGVRTRSGIRPWMRPAETANTASGRRLSPARSTGWMETMPMGDDPQKQGDFAKGQEEEPDHRERGRFSSGQAEKPDEKHPTGDFAEGQEDEGEKH